MNGSMCPPVINNINVLPAHSAQQLLTSTDPVSSNTILADFIDISGPLDTAVEEYTAWQKSCVRCVIFKEQIAKAGEVALENCLNLKQIDKDQDPEFFVKRGVKVGAARRFVSEIRC